MPSWFVFLFFFDLFPCKRPPALFNFCSLNNKRSQLNCDLYKIDRSSKRQTQKALILPTALVCERVTVSVRELESPFSKINSSGVGGESWKVPTTFTDEVVALTPTTMEAVVVPAGMTTEPAGLKYRGAEPEGDANEKGTVKSVGKATASVRVTVWLCPTALNVMAEGESDTVLVMVAKGQLKQVMVLELQALFKEYR